MSTIESQKESFTSFYTTGPFWALERPNVEDPNFNVHFTENMSEIVFSREITDFKIRIARDGCIEFQDNRIERRVNELDGSITNLIELWSEYLNVANCIFLLLEMAVLEKQDFAFFNFQEITRNDAFRVSYTDGKFNGMGIQVNSNTGSLQMGRFLSSYHTGLPLAVDTRIITRHPVKEESLNRAVELLSCVLPNEGLIDKLSSFSKALSEYKIGNYKISIVLCWFVLERIINEKYVVYLESKNREIDGRKRINSDRKKLLTGRDYTASIMSNILELDEVINTYEFDMLNRVRQIRNDIAHGLNKQEVNNENCAEILDFTFRFTLYGIIEEPKLNLGLSSSGL